MKTLKFIKSAFYLFAILGIASSCSKKLEEELPSLSPTDSYEASFNSNLVAAGMSEADAAQVSGLADLNAAGFNSKLVAASADTPAKAKDSVAHAMGKVSDDSIFADATAKKNAVEQISQAQLATLAELSDEADLSSTVNEVAPSLSSDLEDTGLTGSDLEEAIGRQGKGIAKALLQSNVNSSLHGEVIAGFSKGAVEGLFDNTNLAPSGTTLISALTGGLINEVGSGSGSTLSGADKGQLIKEILSGVKTEINNRTDISDSNKEGYVNGILDKGSSLINEIGDSTAGSAIKDGLFNGAQELHIVCIYEPILSSSGDATINIVSGTKPIVLALLSYRATTWHFTGATDRISKIITHAVNSNTLDLTGISPTVEVVPKDASFASFYGIRPASGFYYDLSSPWTKALSVKLRQKTGFHVTSFQGAYTQNAFTVGDGLNLPGGFPSLTLSRPWLYSFDYRGVKSYQSSGMPRVDVILWLTSVLSSGLSVRVWVENVTTTTSDIPAFDHTYTINAGIPNLQVIIPFNQSNTITATRTFKVHIETTDGVLNYQKVVDGSLIGSSGVTNLGTSGYNSGSYTPILLL